VLAREALRVTGQGGRADGAREAVTYGDFAAGTARRTEFSPGVEHIGVLYSEHTQAAALAWLEAAFGRAPTPRAFVDARGPWLGLLLIGVLMLAWPLSRLLPAASAQAGAGPARQRWRRFWPLAVVPALSTPLILWKLPSDFLPILLGDYLMLHFGLYGLITAAGLMLARRGLWRPGPVRGVALLVAVALASAYALFAVGVPLDRYVFNVLPTGQRWLLIPAIFAGTLPWFLADEWLARDPRAARGACFVTKLCFLMSLVLAIALNLNKLFFLAIIVPAILLLFIVYGLFSGCAFRRTGHPAVGAIANALAFACFIAVTFPLVS
jgi:hypothetical protein